MHLTTLFPSGGAIPAAGSSSGHTLFETIVLNELTWHERSPLTDILEQNRGRFIHFSKVPKLGVNPRKAHNDPHGIYFYPVDWTLSKVERIQSGQQYGFDWPYYFLVDIDQSSPGLVLSKVTWDDVHALAQRNGWTPLLDEFLDSDPAEQKKLLPYYAKDTAASILWHLLDRAQREDKVRWNKAFAGLSWIYDDNQAIINNMEPCQLIVLDPRVIRNATMGDNKHAVSPAADSEKNADKIYGTALTRLMKSLQRRYGGTIRWQENTDKRPYDSNKPKAKNRARAWPSLSFEAEGKHFLLDVSDRWGGVALNLSYTFHREKGQDRVVAPEHLRDEDMTRIEQRVVDAVDKVLPHKEDLRFTPVFSDKQARQYLAQLTGDTPFKVEVEIDNDPRFPHIRYWATHTFKADDLELTTLVGLFMRPDSFSPTITIRPMDENSARFGLSVSQVGDFDRDGARDSGQKLLAGFKDALHTRGEFIGPENRSYPNLSEQQFNAWKGWFVTHCGLSFGDRLAAEYADEIAAWEADTDKAYLLERFARVMGPRGY